MLLLAVAAAVHWALPAPWREFRLFASDIVAASLASAGFSVMLIAWWQFRQRRVAICPTAPTTSLITDGMYRYSRNPMYLGMLLMLGGAAAFFGTLPFHVAWLAFFLIIDRVFCGYEERKLAAAFGAEFDAYRAKVKRWV